MVTRGRLRDIVIPVRLATSQASGSVVQSLSFLLDHEALWCATPKDSAHRYRGLLAARG